MSFWKRTLMGGEKGSSSELLPNKKADTGANSTMPETNVSSPPPSPASQATTAGSSQRPSPSSPTAAAAAIGPPPIAAAYMHSPHTATTAGNSTGIHRSQTRLSPLQQQRRPAPVPSSPPAAPPLPPKVHIFQPKQSPTRQEQASQHEDDSMHRGNLVEEEQEQEQPLFSTDDHDDKSTIEASLTLTTSSSAREKAALDEKDIDGEPHDVHVDGTSDLLTTNDGVLQEGTNATSSTEKQSDEGHVTHLVPVKGETESLGNAENESTNTDKADDSDGILLLEPTSYQETLTSIHPGVESSALVLRQQDEGMASTPLSPKFDFLNDAVPLEKLQDSTSKRRHESQTRIHQLVCKLASLQAKLANEAMDRGSALTGKTLDSIATQPLQAAVEKIGNQLVLSSSPPKDASLHSRLAALEVRRRQHANVDLPDVVAVQIESPQTYVSQELQASLRLETTKADKRLGSMVRRFEAIAGTVARRHQEEAASRRATLVQVQSLAQDAADLDERRALEFLEALKKLRELVQREREEREARDKEVMELIVERTVELKRALLEAAGSGG